MIVIYIVTYYYILSSISWNIVLDKICEYLQDIFQIDKKKKKTNINLRIIKKTRGIK